MMLRIVLAISIFLYAGISQAENRALVFGNDAYDELPSLVKAIEDAEGYSNLLEAQGFDVTLVRNADMREMRSALARFYDSIQPGDTAVFIYSGHGWSDGSQNFLVPTDTAQLGSPSLAVEFSIPLKNGANGILDNIARRGASLSVSIIDACRNNPFEAQFSRATGVTRGLAPIEPAEGTFLVFSAGAGQAALDRLGDADTQQYSVFTRFFLRNLAESGDLRKATITTRQQVQQAAQIVGANQRPAYYDELSGTSCLFGDCNSAQPAQQTIGVVEEWGIVRRTSSTVVLNAFIAKWPTEPLYIALAQEALSKLAPPEVIEIVPEIEVANNTRTTPEIVDLNALPVQRLDTIEADALAFLDQHIKYWSQSDAAGIDLVWQNYADQVTFFNQPFTQAMIRDDKRRFAARWPFRDYSLDTETASVSCVDNQCTVEIQGSFFARSLERGETTRGLVAQVYIVDMSGDPKITSETSQVIARY